MMRQGKPALTLLRAAAMLLVIPLAAKLPYLFDAWLYSPLDRPDAVFWLAAVAWSAWHLFRRKRGVAPAAPPRTLAGGMLIPPALLLWWITMQYQINSLAIMTAILLIMLAVWFSFGWKHAETHLPAFVLAGLGSPSSAYWTEFYLGGLPGVPGLSGFQLKLLFAILFIAIWIMTKTLLSRSLSPHGAIFFASAGAVAGMILIGTQELPSGGPVSLDPAMTRRAEWIGQEQELSPLDRHFFAGSKASRRIYFDYNTFIAVLEVEPGANVHQIHPVGICLRSAGWRITSQRQIMIPEINLQCEELSVVTGGQKFLIFAWFTDGAISTGNFKTFRRRWRTSRDWQVFQLMTPADGDEREAAERLKSFLRLFSR